jgi:predicted PurR-regulated permease PerM
MSEKTERVITISYTTLIRVVVVLCILVFLWTVREIVALIFVALVLAAIMMPFVTWLRKYRIPPTLSAMLFYVFLFGGIGSAVAMVLPQLVIQLSKLGLSISRFWDAIWNGTAFIRQFAEQYGLQENVSAGITSLETSITSALGNAVLSLTGLLGGIAATVIILVLAFYMVVQEREAIKALKDLLPNHQDFVTNILLEVQRKFGRWLIGQLILSGIVGVLYFIGLSILGVEGAFVLALVAAFAEFIPYVGPILCGTFVVIVSLSQSPMQALLAVGIMLLIQQTESHILIPKVMQKAVGLNPVISIVALLVSAKLFGIIGVVLAIPAATAIMVAVMEYRRYTSLSSESDKSVSFPDV